MIDIEYYQPEFDEELVDKNGDEYFSSEVWIQKEKVQDLFPDSKILSFSKFDIGYFEAKDVNWFDCPNIYLAETLCELADIGGIDTQNFLDDNDGEVYEDRKLISSFYTKEGFLSSLEDIKERMVSNSVMDDDSTRLLLDLVIGVSNLKNDEIIEFCFDD